MARDSYAGIIIPRFWDELRHVSVEARCLGAFLITGRFGMDVPGLIVAGPGALSEEAGIDPDRLAAALAELVEVGFAEVDQAHRMIRIPNAPQYGHHAQHKLIRAWWSKWKRLPDSTLKYEHIPSLKKAMSDVPAALSTESWEETFGSVDFNPSQRGSATGSLTPSPRVGEPLSQPSVVSGQCDLLPEQHDPCQKPPPKAVRPKLDFDALYRLYPRKDGKAKGLEKAKREIKTPADYERLRLAIVGYVEKLRSEDTETRYVKYFSTFMGCWQDYLPTASSASPTPSGTTPRPTRTPAEQAAYQAELDRYTNREDLC